MYLRPWQNFDIFKTVNFPTSPQELFGGQVSQLGDQCSQLRSGSSFYSKNVLRFGFFQRYLMDKTRRPYSCQPCNIPQNTNICGGQTHNFSTLELEKENRIQRKIFTGFTTVLIRHSFEKKSNIQQIFPIEFYIFIAVLIEWYNQTDKDGPYRKLYTECNFRPWIMLWFEVDNIT